MARLGPIVSAFTKRRGVTVEPGWGDGNVVLKLNAKIFAILGETRLVVKLPKQRVDELVDAGSGTRFDPRKNGRVMKEWFVPGARMKWLELVTEAFAFASQPSTRKRQASARARRS